MLCSPDAWVKPVFLQGVKVVAWKDFLELGKSHPAAPTPPKEDDPATIMYTSGTTGAV